MSISNPLSAKVANLDTISATEANAIGVALTRAVDGVGGGTYTPASTISISDLTISGSAKVKFTSRTIARASQGACVSATGANGWTFDPGTDLWTSATTSACLLRVPVEIPNAATITLIQVWYDGFGGHAAFPGGAPAQKPRVYLKSYEINTQSLTTHGTYADASATAGAYEAPHVISSGAISITVDKGNRRYWLVVESESGANAIAGAQFLGAYVAFTSAAYDDGAG